MLGICYGFQAMARTLGGEVAHTGLREYGGTTVDGRPRGVGAAARPARRAVGVDEPRRQRAVGAGGLHGGGRHVRRRRSRRSRTATASCSASSGTRRSGTRPSASRCCVNFLHAAPGSRPTGRPAAIIDEQVARIQAQVGDGRVICGLSGGVDSAVAAALVQRAVGDRLTCVFVDHGLLRAGEAEQVERDFVAATGVRLKVVDAADRFLDALAGRDRPGGEAEDHRAGVHPRLRAGRPRGRRRGGAEGERGRASSCRARSTRTSSSPAAAPAPRPSRATTTSAACPTTCGSTSSSRCGRCSRTRCAPSASSSACPRRSCTGSRSRAPGWVSGSSGRSPADRLETLRAADAIARQELTAAGLDREIWQCPVVLLADVRSRRRPGRRPHLRSPRRAAAGLERGRHDGGLEPAAVRRAGARLDADHATRSPA